MSGIFNPFNGTLVDGQLAFPATQNASANANTLDDYEEGNWTPVIGGSGGTSGQTYSVQVGKYVKIGQLVIASFEVTLSAKGTITSNVQIQGLPFTVLAASTWIFSIGWYNLATSWVSIFAQNSNDGGTAFTVFGVSAAATGMLGVTLLTADIAANSLFRGTLIYRATA
ncbi:MAG: hypothetical protein Q8O42_09510 [Acidobacteriota bacterium]|nr:hypothetical protein [Acidobacteriota bacterium]